MDDREIVLYRKLQELKSFNIHTKDLSKHYQQLWTPSNLSNLSSSLREIEDIEPYIKLTQNQQEYDIIRRCIHSMEFVIGIGRALRFEVRNKPDDKLLGMIVLASDVPSIECRDEYLGWDKNISMSEGMLRHTAVMSSCVGVQPFANNTLGCKMVAMMVNEPLVRNTWKEKYGDELVGITTTSLHGSFSVYNGKKHYPVYVSEDMIGHKLGEFVFTRTYKGHSGARKQ